MLKSFVLALLALATLSIAQASPFEDRARLAHENSFAQQDVDLRSSMAGANLRRMQAYQRFAAQHGGLRDGGNCFVRERGACRPNVFDHSLLSCDQQNARAPLQGFDPYRGDVLTWCELTLADGLACKLDLTGEATQGARRTAQCFDANGAYSEVPFTYSEVGSVRQLNGKKRAPRRR